LFEWTRCFTFSKPVLEALTPLAGCFTDGQTADFDHQNQMRGGPGCVHPEPRCSKPLIQARLCVIGQVCMVQPHPAFDFLNRRLCFCRAAAHCVHHLSFFGFGCLQPQLLAGQMNFTALQKTASGSTSRRLSTNCYCSEKSRAFQSGSGNRRQTLNSFASASIAAPRRIAVAIVRRAARFVAFATNQIFFKLAHNILMFRLCFRNEPQSSAKLSVLPH